MDQAWTRRAVASQHKELSDRGNSTQTEGTAPRQREQPSDRGNSIQTEGTALRQREQHPDRGNSPQTEGTAPRQREQPSDRGNSTQTEATALRQREQHPDRGNSKNEGEDLERSPPKLHILGRSLGCSGHLLDGTSWAAASCRIWYGRESDLRVGEIAIM